MDKRDFEVSSTSFTYDRTGRVACCRRRRPKDLGLGGPKWEVSLERASIDCGTIMALAWAMILKHVSKFEH